MIYQSTNIDRVISKIFRDTRANASDYLGDFYEWIPEAMGLMQTKFPLVLDHADVKTEFHKGKLPKGLKYILAVEYNGMRLRKVDQARNYSAYTQPYVDPVFEYVPTTKMMPSGPVLDIQIVARMPENPALTYTADMGYISTSEADITVRVHFMKIPLDDRGFPLIPDNQNYKEALYYYVRYKMVGSGFEDPLYNRNFQDLLVLFEKYADRAINEITYPTPEDTDRMLDQVRFIQDPNFFENFYLTDGGR